jgi:ubiquinone/menaquinone biosynthesis C-methylase UbiE
MDTYFEGASSAYREGYGEEVNKVYLDEMFRFVSHFCSSGRLLDIGCAYGLFLSRCDSMFRTYGIDVADVANECKNNTAAVITISDASLGLPYDDKMFDVVTMFFSIEHMNNPKKVLLEACRVMVQGGSLIIFTDNKYSFYRVLGMFFKKYKDPDRTHISINSMKFWKRQLKNSGFAITFSECRDFPGSARFKLLEHMPFFRHNIRLVAKKVQPISSL